VTPLTWAFTLERVMGFGRILFVSSVAAFHRRHRRPALCGVQGRAAWTDPLPGLPARRDRSHGQRAGAGAGRRDQDAARRPSSAARQVPAGRLGQPSQVADLAAAILAKAYLTNQVISLDGGIYPR
jgi:3-oxoacyl-[acyl-carrier protein] reductase